jgi:hypothetical protein
MAGGDGVLYFMLMLFIVFICMGNSPSTMEYEVVRKTEAFLQATAFDEPLYLPADIVALGQKHGVLWTALASITRRALNVRFHEEEGTRVRVILLEQKEDATTTV